jgi:hypothetical protein
MVSMKAFPAPLDCGKWFRGPRLNHIIDPPDEDPLKHGRVRPMFFRNRLAVDERDLLGRLLPAHPGLNGRAHFPDGVFHNLPHLIEYLGPRFGSVPRHNHLHVHLLERIQRLKPFEREGLVVPGHGVMKDVVARKKRLVFPDIDGGLRRDVAGQGEEVDGHVP